MSNKQRLVLFVSILASFVAFLDGSVVNVALPAITHEFGGGLTLQQWVVDAYLITLGSLMLIAGSFSDIFGRLNILRLGLVGFGISSLLCAIAPDGVFLVISRGLQGIAGALLVPSSLALIISNFPSNKQGKAIGSWTAWTGIAFVVGPLLGGFLVDFLSWRWIFAINVLPIALTLWFASKLETDRPSGQRAKIDALGAALCAVGLGGAVFALIEEPRFGWSHPMIFVTLALGVTSLALFLWHEAHTKQPMLPLKLFKVRNFSAGNIATFAIYAALSMGTFVVTVFVQQYGHLHAMEAGLSLLPITLIMFFLSPRFGALSSRLGPRLFMTIGPIVAAVGMALLINVGYPVHYITDLLPGVLVFGLGLSTTVAPLTSAILGAIHPKHAGTASAVNNAVARIAGLLGIAAIGVIAGANLSRDAYREVIITVAILLALGGIISFIGIRNPAQEEV